MDSPAYTEIETKLQVADLVVMAERLRAEGATFLGTHGQRDDYLDRADRTLTAGDCCLRLRTETGPAGRSLHVTYKGPRVASSCKRRPEFEFRVSDAEAVRRLFAELGYRRALVVDKTRELWQLAGCHVALDRLPEIGGFVEIEGPDEASVAAVQERLGLADRPHIVASYAALVADMRRAQAAPPPADDV